MGQRRNYNWRNSEGLILDSLSQNVDPMAKEEEISIMAGKLRKDCSYSNVLEAAMKIPKEQHPALYGMLKEYDFSKIIFDKTADPERRRGAILIYSQIGPPDKMKSLFPLALDSNESEGVRMEALFSLEKAGIADKSFIPVIDSTQNGIPIREAAIYALGTSKVEPKVLSALFKKYLKDKSEILRAAGAVGLGRLGDEKAIPILEKALKNETDEFTRKMIKEALFEIAVKSTKKKSKLMKTTN